MRILIIANDDVGLYRFRKELIEELIHPGQVVTGRVAEKHDVYIALPDGSRIKDLTSKGCIFFNTPMDRRGMRLSSEITLFRLYRKIIAQVKPDLVLTYTIKPNIYCGILSRIRKIPYVANITGLGSAFYTSGFLASISKKLYQIALRKAKTVFFENSENLKAFVKMGIVSKIQAHQLNGAGINLQDFPLTAYPQENDGIRFLFIGRVMREKGIEEFFQAAEIIKTSWPNTQFDVVGPLEDDYQKLVDSLQQKGVITFWDEQDDVRPFIERSHCFVLPSYHEGMANTLLESAAMGRPLITSDIPGCREAVQVGVNGFLCSPKDIPSLVNAIRLFLALSHADKAQMGLASRDYIASVFDKKEVVRETIDQLFW